MIDPKIFDTFAQQVGKLVPPGLSEIQKDIEKNVKQMFQNAVSEMGLVSREEFDTQTMVLARTREKLEDLKKRVSELEELLQKEES